LRAYLVFLRTFLRIFWNYSTRRLVRRSFSDLSRHSLGEGGRNRQKWSFELKTGITMKPNDFTFYISPFSSSRFTFHSSRVFPPSQPASLFALHLSFPPQSHKNFPLTLVTLFMQNEPNFTMHPSNLSAVLIATYNERTLPDMTKTNPIEPNTDPIEKRLIINANFSHNSQYGPN